MIMEGLLGLVSSKKAIAGGALVVCSTVLVALGKLTVDQWMDYSKWIFTVYAGAETANGVAATIKGAGKGEK
jgi:hypothetical protein